MSCDLSLSLSLSFLRPELVALQSYSFTASSCRARCSHMDLLTTVGNVKSHAAGVTFCYACDIEVRSGHRDVLLVSDVLISEALRLLCTSL